MLRGFTGSLRQRVRDETEHQQRLSRSAAYARIPETGTERALSDISVSPLFDGYHYEAVLQSRDCLGVFASTYVAS